MSNSCTENGEDPEISFVVEEEKFSPGEALREPISVSAEQRKLVSTQIQKYIGSLSQNNPDEKLLLDFFNRANHIIVRVGREYTNGRFGFFVEKDLGPIIKINIQESELKVIAEAGQFNGIETGKSEKSGWEGEGEGWRRKE